MHRFQRRGALLVDQLQPPVREEGKAPVPAIMDVVQGYASQLIGIQSDPARSVTQAFKTSTAIDNADHPVLSVSL